MKLTVSTMVGSLYESEERHPLRDAGFSIFYISVNISSFFGPLLIGLLQENIGFYFGFGAAAVGMALGLSIYASKRAVLPHTPPLNPLPDSQKKTAAAIALAGAAASGVLNTGNFPQVLLSCVLLAVVVYFVRLFTSPRIDAQHKRYVVAYIPMFIAVSLFVALFMQFYTVVTVYFEETVNRNFLGFTVPVSWKDSLESVWVILLSGMFAALWTKMGKRQPKTPLKFALSLMVMGVTFLCFVPFVASGKPMSMLVFALLLIIFSDGRIAALADCHIVRHQNRPTCVENANGGAKLLGVFHRLHAGRAVVQKLL